MLIERVKGLDPKKIFDSYARSCMAVFFKSLKFVFARKADLLFVNTWSVAGVAAFLVKKIFGIPYIVFAHGFDVLAPNKSRKARVLMKMVLGNAAFVIANSDFTKKLIENIVRKERIMVVHPVVGLSRFVPKGQPLKAKFGSNQVILTVARLVESKGHESVIRALVKVCKYFPECKYVVVGEGPLELSLKALVSDLGLEKTVIFEKGVTDEMLPSYYEACDIFVLASREISERGEVEGFGIVFLEAAAAAKAVIAGNSGGVPEAVIDGKTGILVDPLDSEGIAACIVRLLQDEKTRVTMGNNGRERVTQELNPEKLKNQLQRILNAPLA
jgi:phosphatidylinositol alpha-1,6-mannosyltransferase